MNIFLHHHFRRNVFGILLILSLLMASASVYAQVRNVSGVVANAKQGPIPGASVYEKGTANGTMTDADGKFSLNVSENATLVITSIGFLKAEILVSNQAVINVGITEDMIGLDEVVVVGYGEQKRSNVSGAVASVSVAAMENKSQLRIDQALQGMVAGVTVARNGGAPGDKPTIHIRGVGSTGNTEPLWVVDGIRMEPGNQFDLDDVESIEVLKDAAAGAIYGVKAANGVILVTTKRGKGDLRVNFKSSVSQRQAINLPTFLSSEDFVFYKKQGRINAGQNPEPEWDNYQHDTDWVDAYYAGSGVLQSYDLSVSRGDEKANYFLSFGHDNEKGILIDNGYKRYSIRLNSDVKILKWITLGESVLLSRVQENPISNFNENYAGGIPYRSIPIMPVYDTENKYGGWGRGPVYFQGPNPIATQYQQHEDRTYNRIDGNVYLDVKPVKGLQLRSTFGFNYLSYSLEKFDEAFDYGSFANPIAALTYGSSNELSLTANTVATYSKSIGKHSVKIMGGIEASRFDGKHFNVVGNNFPVDIARSLSLSTGAVNVTDRRNINQSRILSYFGRFNYDFDERFLIEANLRRDSHGPKFGPDYRWGLFPSVSAGWRISQEQFFQNVPFITNLKIRGSYGRLGSDSNVQDFTYLKTYTSQFSTYAFDESGSNRVVGFYIGKYPNKNVHWEEVNMSNVAIDLKAFENKFSLSLDYYVKNTTELLFKVPLPASIGIATHNFDSDPPHVNIGSMQNKGIDIDLGYTTKVQKFNINVTGNLSFVKNTIKKLNNNEYIIDGGGGGQIGGMTRTEAGHPISSFYGYVVQQMLNTSADIYAINTYADDGTYQEAGTGPGDFMYKDLSGPDGKPDGEITPQFDRTYIGNPWPKRTYALNISVSYNNILDLSLQFQGVQGVDVFNANKAYTRNFFGDNNTTTDIYDAWTPERYTSNPRNIANDPNGNFSRPSTYFIENGSYLKLRNLQIGFNFPKSILERIKIQRIRLYANANNVFTITKYSGFDPEIAGSNLGRGVDYGYYPQVRTYGVGAEVQF